MRTLPTKSRSMFGACLWRGVLAAALATATILTLFARSSTKSSNPIDQVLREAVDQKKVPGVVAMVSVADRVTYQGATGKRDTIKNIPMTADSIFRIASMTKPITSVAVMQLVENGRVKLDEPAATYLPELSQVQVLEELMPAPEKRNSDLLSPPPPSGNCLRTRLDSSTNFSIRSCTAMLLPERFLLYGKEAMVF